MKRDLPSSEAINVVIGIKLVLELGGKKNNPELYDKCKKEWCTSSGRSVYELSEREYF
jgi:hypothetical protein